MRQDNLNERNAEFVQAPLKTPVFLNSVPKCGTHLIRNIMRMFVPVPQQYHATFIQHTVLRDHAHALSPANPMLSWGHLLFSDAAAILLRPVRHIVLVRDPYSWVLARARFFLSENFDGLMGNIKSGAADPNDILNMMIFGVHTKAPSLEEIFRFNAAAWMGTTTKLYRYEDIVANLKRLDSAEAETFFKQLLADCAIDPVPADWRTRVLIGSDRKQSSTARENLAGVEIDLPDELPDIQKRLVDYAAPGLRALLGYGPR
jgi:hypothetical protein